MKNNDLVLFMQECGLCEVCQLRYLRARGNEYEDKKQTFAQLGVTINNAQIDDELPNKKQRLSICSTCLGLFSEEFQQQLIADILATNIEKYESDAIVLAISLPMLLQVRQLSMWYALQRKFGDEINAHRSNEVPLKEAIKLIINAKVCKELGKQYDTNNGLMISIALSHAQESVEMAQLRQLHTQQFRKNGKVPEISRGLLDKSYTPAQISADLFEQFLPIPPAIPVESLRLKSVELTGPTVYVAGRYCKVSRHLSHSPWLLAGKRVIESSIEELVTDTMKPYFCTNESSAFKNKVVFISSGREDVDVRCLGKGRPFVVEINNALRQTLPEQEAVRMEQIIEKSGKVCVRDLQMVEREELVHIKSGEENKRKHYRALCKVEETIIDAELLEKLNIPAGFEIAQKTPIRVLHRRPLHTRPRQVYSVKAYAVPKRSDLLVLDVVSQAGTYIKELVHGELGRTTPSISAIIGKPIDIMALDVMGIDLDWPKQLHRLA